MSGLRYNNGKRKWGLFPWNAAEEIVKVLEQGAQKYAPFNWQKGLSWVETYESLQRHCVAWISGEDIDKETGLHHMAHAGCNALFLTWFWLTGKGKDDRNLIKEEPIEKHRSTREPYPVEFRRVPDVQKDLCETTER